MITGEDIARFDRNGAGWQREPRETACHLIAVAVSLAALVGMVWAGLR